MIQLIIVVLAVVSSAFTFPARESFTTAGGQSSPETQNNEQYSGVDTINSGFTHGEKTGVEKLPEIYSHKFTGVESENPVSQNVEKTGVQGLSESYANYQQTGIKSGTPVFTPEGKTESSEVYLTSNQKFTGPESTQPFTNDGQIAFQGSSETYTNQKYVESQAVNSAVPKVESLQQVNNEKTQGSYTERPHILPVQPLSTVPVNQGYSSGQILTPLVVPAEAIATGRVIIMTLEPIRPRIFQQDFTTNSEKQVNYVQKVQPTVNNHSSVPTQTVQPNQQQLFSVQPEVTSQTYANVEKQVPYQQIVSQAVADKIQEQTQPLGYNPNVYQPYSVQQSVSEKVENQLPYQQSANPQSSGYVSAQTQTLEPHQQQFSRSQEVTTPLQTQSVEPNQQQYSSVQPVASSNVEKQATQISTFDYNVEQSQNFEKHSQKHPSNVQPDTIVSNEKQVPYQQSVPKAADKAQGQTQPLEYNHYTYQPSKIQQAATEKTENQVQYQQASRPQTNNYVQEQVYKTQELQPNQQQYSNVQPQVSNFAVNNADEYAFSNFGEKLPQHQSVQSQADYNPTQTLSAVAYNQENSVKPSTPLVASQQDVSSP